MKTKYVIELGEGELRLIQSALDARFEWVDQMPLNSRTPLGKIKVMLAAQTSELCAKLDRLQPKDS